MNGFATGQAPNTGGLRGRHASATKRPAPGKMANTAAVGHNRST